MENIENLGYYIGYVKRVSIMKVGKYIRYIKDYYSRAGMLDAHSHLVYSSAYLAKCYQPFRQTFYKKWYRFYSSITFFPKVS